jgi:hypothetical protein
VRRSSPDFHFIVSKKPSPYRKDLLLGEIIGFPVLRNLPSLKRNKLSAIATKIE